MKGTIPFRHGTHCRGYELCCVALWGYLTRNISIICTACCASLKEQGISLQKVSLTAINSYDGRKDIRAWLFTIARNTYFTYCKREKIYVEWEPPTEQVDIQTEFIDNLINKEQVEKIHNFLKNMKDHTKS